MFGQQLGRGSTPGSPTLSTPRSAACPSKPDLDHHPVLQQEYGQAEEGTHFRSYREAYVQLQLASPLVCTQLSSHHGLCRRTLA